MGIWQSVKSAPGNLISAVKNTIVGIGEDIADSWRRNGYQALGHSATHNAVDAGSAVVHSLNPKAAGTAANVVGRAGARMASIGINITSGIVKIGAPIFAVVGIIAAYKAIKHYAASRKQEDGIPDAQFTEMRDQVLQQNYTKGEAKALAETSLMEPQAAGIEYRTDNAARIQQRRGGAAVDPQASIAQREQARAATAAAGQNSL